MNTESIKQLLEQFKTGALSTESVIEQLRKLPFENADQFAKVDHHRAIRCGMPEVIYCPGKTADQIVDIFGKLAAHGNNVLATRAEQSVYDAIVKVHPKAVYEQAARCVVLRLQEKKTTQGHIAVVSAGTSDIPVAEEARVTAEILNQTVKTIYDVGVAGLHRLLSHTDQLQSANAIIVVAGMEGALASVVGGLVAVPVIGVPTSIGYGASFGGIAPLLTMLNSCAAGVCVVNIDNGFAAGCIAAMINRRCEKQV